MFEKLKYLSFKSRILLGFCILIVMMIGVVNVSLYQFSKMQMEAIPNTKCRLPVSHPGS